MVSPRTALSLLRFLAVGDDIVGITDLRALFTQPSRTLLLYITKEVSHRIGTTPRTRHPETKNRHTLRTNLHAWCQVLIRKDKHQVSLVERLFGRKVEEQCRGAGVTKSIVYPELYFAWLARFLKRDQGLLVDPFGIAVNETGTLLISDHNAILTAKLSNPVNVTQLTGGGAAATTVSTSGNLGSCRFENVRGICFIAREVAVVCDVTASTLKVVHVNDQPGWFQLRISETRLSSFLIERPYGIATLRRLDAMAPNPNQRNPNHRAIVAVTEYDRPTILLLSIEQDKSSRTKPYTVTAAVRVGILPVPRSQRLLRGVAGAVHSSHRYQCATSTS